MSDPKSQSEFADKLTDYVISAVDSARERAVDPLLALARVMVYGLLAGIVALSASITLAILLVRLFHIYLGNIPGVTEEVWVAHLVTGLVFLIIGMVFWRLRRTPDTKLSSTHDSH